MTNAEKYLKDGVNIDELTFKFDDWHFKNSDVIGYGEALFRFLQEQEKPTLTEDERVILRNIKDGIDTIMSVTICRSNGELYIEIPSTQEKIELYMFNHLFQFIKERRRILY